MFSKQIVRWDLLFCMESQKHGPQYTAKQSKGSAAFASFRITWRKPHFLFSRGILISSRSRI